ncbi:uncharacterized protein LOC110095652 [Dendrobium catenatum]|uniref:uncharacterized protein LOC110095652 n=1 Tax=Dendrobium catenatum TaxID=906689 RepID=UPI0009F4937E|nr:uncharacterized protein LOC110095652 [Dendrobium catenatum]
MVYLTYASISFWLKLIIVLLHFVKAIVPSQRKLYFSFHLKETNLLTFQQPDGLAFLNEKASKKVNSKKILKEMGPAGSGDASSTLSIKLCKSIRAVEAQPISCKPMTCVLQFDGASKGNPGMAGAAAVLRNGDGSVVSCIREGLGIATNNVAEYRALILGMKYALMKGFKHIQVQGDSQLICMQEVCRFFGNASLSSSCPPPMIYDRSTMAMKAVGSNTMLKLGVLEEKA